MGTGCLSTTIMLPSRRKTVSPFYHRPCYGWFWEGEDITNEIFPQTHVVNVQEMECTIKQILAWKTNSVLSFLWYLSKNFIMWFGWFHFRISKLGRYLVIISRTCNHQPKWCSCESEAFILAHHWNWNAELWINNILLEWSWVSKQTSGSSAER